MAKHRARKSSLRGAVGRRFAGSDEAIPSPIVVEIASSLRSSQRRPNGARNHVRMAARNDLSLT